MVSQEWEVVRFLEEKRGIFFAYIACARMRSAHNACGEMTGGGGGDKVATYTGACARSNMPPQYAAVRSGMHSNFNDSSDEYYTQTYYH